MYLIDDIITKYYEWKGVMSPLRETLKYTISTAFQRASDFKYFYPGVGHEYNKTEFTSQYWLLADLIPADDRVMQWDILLGLPYKDKTLEKLHLKHIIGMLEIDQVDFLFSEIKRVLNSNGIVELCYTDWDRIANSYIKGDLTEYEARRFIFGNHSREGEFRKSIWTKHMIRALCVKYNLEIVPPTSLGVGYKKFFITHKGIAI